MREWNRLRKVVIHAIGIGSEHDRRFMEQLALQNGGAYVVRN